MAAYVIGVDVGTGSARAALVSASSGHIQRVASCVTHTWSQVVSVQSKDGKTHTALTLEQSTEDIWNACCNAVKDVIGDVPPESIKGIGFDATCSLAVVDENGKPVSVSVSGDDNRNVILWMDHRAIEEADFINSLQNDVLKYVGGQISLEMQTPKLMWLKKHLREKCWNRAKHYMDLPDFLTWRATNSLTRSLCSLVCKWTYRAGVGPNGTNSGWSEKYFKEIGLEDLADNNWSKIGNDVLVPGAACGNGLTTTAATELGLLPGTAVGTSIIDAHAGGLGLLGCEADGVSNDFPSRLALICGTSTCHMAVERSPHFVRGVWGPYWSAMVPGMWLSEGGQSATGCLVDHIINSHPAAAGIRAALPNGVHIQSYLNDLLDKIAEKRSIENVAKLTSSLHVWPDFHGNRSPIADPALLGMISGLNLATDEENLAILYLATIQALAVRKLPPTDAASACVCPLASLQNQKVSLKQLTACCNASWYGTRHIVEALRSSGLSKLESVLLCGGLSRNRLFVQSHADILGLPVLCAREPESVLLGSAMLGSYAAGLYPTLEEAVHAMGGPADKILPDKILAKSKYHEKKYTVFKKMLDDQREYDRIMTS